MLSNATGVVQVAGGVSLGGVGGVDSGHEFAVGGAGGGEVLVALLELQAQVDDLLLEVGDLLGEGVGIDGRAQRSCGWPGYRSSASCRPSRTLSIAAWCPQTGT
jgi:hypothetical protein